MTTQTTLKLLPPPPPRIDTAALTVPTSVVCPTCKEETGLTPENIVNQPIEDNICCPVCSNVIYSCVPEKPRYAYGSGSHTTIYDDYD